MSRAAVTDGREPLTTARVLQAAIVFADRDGIDALTMRKVADELGYGVMSLYNHVANKDEMLDGMVDRVAAEIEHRPPGASGGQGDGQDDGGDDGQDDGDDEHWKATLRLIAGSAHRTLMRHPWAGQLWTSRRPGPARLRHMEALLTALGAAGFGPELVYRGFHAISMHIVGFTLQELDFQFDHTEMEAMANEFVAEIEGDHPNLAAHVRAHLDPDLAGDAHGGDEFDFVLGLILDGLERSNRPVGLR